MPRRFLQRYLPTPIKMREHKALRPLGNLLHNPHIWHMHRRSISGAVFIGFFVAFLPVPGQMLIAALAAIVLRCNLPLSVALVWITNPVTIPPMFFFAYKLGAWILDREPTVTSVQLSWDWLTTRIDEIWLPLLLGSLICGWVSGVTAMLAMWLLWRLHVIQRWRERRERRARRAAARQHTGEATRAARQPD